MEDLGVARWKAETAAGKVVASVERSITSVLARIDILLGDDVSSGAAYALEFRDGRWSTEACSVGPPEPAAPLDARDLFVHAVSGLGPPKFEAVASSGLSQNLA